MKLFATLVVVFAFVLMATAAFAGEWTGQIVEKDGKLWFKSGDNVLSITNPEKAAEHKGHNVKVTGTADTQAQTLTIDTVSMEAEAAAATA